MSTFREIKTEINEFFHTNKITKAFLWIFVACFPLYLTMGVTSLAFEGGEGFTTLLHQNAGAFYYGLFLVVFVYLVFLSITPRVALGAGLTGCVFVTLALVDHFKFLVLKEHFLPWDLLLAKNLGSFTEFLGAISIPQGVWELVFTTIFYVGALFFMSPTLPLSLRRRAPLAPLLSLVLYGCLTNEGLRKLSSNLFQLELKASVDQNAFYEENGFLTAFALNCGSLQLSVPQNYSLSYMKHAFEPYLPHTDSGTTFQNPDIIVVLSEAFWDPSVLNGVTFLPDPLENFHAIAESQHSGRMVSPTFGGGTVRPEFEILTGMTTSALPPGNIPYQQYVKKDISSYARNYKNLGYDTLGIHTYQKTFYDRHLAYPFMGFDDFLGEYDLNAEQHWNSGPFITDETIAEEIIYQLDQPRQTSLFLMGITMENHSMYQDKYDEADREITVTGDSLSPEQIITLENFATGVSHSDQALKEIYDYVMAREKPTVVLWYGDHLPTLGKDFDPYTTTGTIASSTAAQWTEEEKYTMFSTPYLVFSNYDTGRPFQGENSTHVSPYFLPALMADYIDAPETLQTNFLLDLYNVSPVISSYYDLYSPTEELPQREKLRELHELMTYDMLIGKNYLAGLK